MSLNFRIEIVASLFLITFTVNNIFSLSISLGYVSHKELRFIILKLEIKLIGVTVKNTISNILCEIKSGVLNIKYKESIFKEV